MPKLTSLPKGCSFQSRVAIAGKAPKAPKAYALPGFCRIESATGIDVAAMAVLSAKKWPWQSLQSTLIPDVKFNWTLSNRDNNIWQQIGNTCLTR